jgi:hypothetical protein
MIITVIVALLQIIACLFCYWFVEIRAFMQCIPEKSPWKAEIVVVKPTANNGYPEMVPLHHGKVSQFFYRRLSFGLNVFRIRMINVNKHGLYFKNVVIYMMKRKKRRLKQLIIHYQIHFMYTFNQKVIKRKMKLIKEYGILVLISKMK